MARPRSATGAAAATTAKPQPTRATAAPSSQPPFGSIEEFLFAVLTLRSNAAYREDVQCLVDYESQPVPHNRWVELAQINDRPYQAARNLIGTWELVCHTLQAHFPKNSDRDIFLKSAPVAYMYAWLRPAIESIAVRSNLTVNYAVNFRAVGQQACEVALTASPYATSFPPLAQQIPQQTTEFYRTAKELTRALTHFG